MNKGECLVWTWATFSVLVSHPIRPKAPSATSIPAILKSLQDEWVSTDNLKDVAKEQVPLQHVHTVDVTQNYCLNLSVTLFNGSFSSAFLSKVNLSGSRMHTVLCLGWKIQEYCSPVNRKATLIIMYQTDDGWSAGSTNKTYFLPSPPFYFLILNLDHTRKSSCFCPFFLF